MIFPLFDRCRSMICVFFLLTLTVLPMEGWAQPATGTRVRHFDDVSTTNIQSPESRQEENTYPYSQTTNSNNPTSTNTRSRYRKTVSDYASTVEGDVETITLNGVSFKMIKVHGGTFRMGATDEQGEDAYETEGPAHEVSVGDFLIGETEVTQQLWVAVMGENPSDYIGDQYPVQCIRYVDCEKFFFKLNYLTNRNFRLPTEAEWEYAARGGNKGVPTKYAGSDDFDAVAWFCNNSGNIPHEVKGKQPNELGLYDMSGNVDEWVVDSWHDYTDAPQNNPKVLNESRERVRRGGGCLDFQRHLRVSDRRGCSELMWNFDIGLRLAE